MAFRVELLWPSSIERNDLERENWMYLDPIMVVGLSQLSISTLRCDITKKKAEEVKWSFTVLFSISDLSSGCPTDYMP
jgi:hypothetical protein